ncbi:MAG: Rrf2 family transcriptional regulator [Verrucomicrobiales bacterium]|nr:Rrf2 family transcriptional regulator [Verrucomicrobiales bacterium]
MKVSKKSEYGARALVEIAMRSRNGEDWHQIAQIAEASRIPEKFLEQILLVLKNGGVLKSRRGVDGGYALNELPENIRLDRVVGLLDGNPVGNAKKSRAGDAADAGARIYHELIQRAQEAALTVLRQVSLNDLVEQVRKQRVVTGESLEYQI